MSDNSWFENNETPPAGRECEVMSCEHNWMKGKVLGRSNYNGELIIETERLGLTFLRQSHQFRPIQKKVVDMTKFAGADIWVVQKGSEKNRRKVGEFKPVFLPFYKPLIKEWNHITGLNEEPEWLEGFEYEVKAADTVYGDECFIGYKTEIRDGDFCWSNVCAVTITGLKDGWVYE